MDILMKDEKYYTLDNAKVYYQTDDRRTYCCLTSIEGSPTELYIPDMINAVPVNSFDVDGLAAGLTSINRFVVSKQNRYFKDVDGVLFSKDGSEMLLYPARRENAEYIVPDGVRVIADSAFSGNQFIRKIVLPQGINTISEFAFGNCCSLVEVTIPNTIVEIRNSAFKTCNVVSDIYYCGSEQDWNDVVIEDDNPNLVIAHKHFSRVDPNDDYGCELNSATDCGSEGFLRKIVIRAHIYNSFIKYHSSNSDELHHRVSEFSEYLTDYEKYLFNTPYSLVKNSSVYADYIHRYSIVAVCLWSIGVLEDFPRIGEGQYYNDTILDNISTLDEVNELISTCVLRDRRELNLYLLDSLLKFWRIWICPDYDNSQKHLIDVIRDEFGEAATTVILKLGLVNEEDDYEFNKTKLSCIKNKYSILVSSKWICIGLMYVVGYTNINENMLFANIKEMIGSFANNCLV